MLKQVTTIRNILGECPVWSANNSTLYWMDLIKPALHAWSATTRAVRTWKMPEYLGGLALRRKGGLVMGLQRGIVCFDPDTGKHEDLATFPHTTGRAIRFNDGKCDSRGRFFIGDMMDPSIAEDKEKASAEKQGAGSIYVLDPDLTLHTRETGFTIPNGFAWNRDESILYLADSHENAIYSYDYEPDSGLFSNPEVFASTKDEPGVPDGACMDEQGRPWSARNGGRGVVRHRHDGKGQNGIHPPVRHPTRMTCGGKNLETLFITTATQGLSEQALQRQPLAGTVLAVEAGVRGIPAHDLSG